MSTLKVTNIQNRSGGSTSTADEIYNGRAKAWVNFDGTFETSPFTIANGGIRAAFNVSSITYNGTGDYTVNFTNAMADANYAVAGSARGRSVNPNGGTIALKTPATKTTSAVQIASVGLGNDTNATTDLSEVNVAIFS